MIRLSVADEAAKPEVVRGLVLFAALRVATAGKSLRRLFSRISRIRDARRIEEGEAQESRRQQKDQRAKRSRTVFCSQGFPKHAHAAADPFSASARRFALEGAS